MKKIFFTVIVMAAAAFVARTFWIKRTGSAVIGGGNTPSCTAGNCPLELTQADNGQSFSYTETSRFTVVLPAEQHADALSCVPAGILGRIADTPPGSNEARFEALMPGTCTLSDQDFSTRITVVPTSEGEASTSGSQSGGQGIAPYQSGVKGTITEGPTCPLSRGSDCGDKPFATLVVIFHKNDPVHAFVLTRSAADGSFSAALPPGEYIVGAGESASPMCPQTSVTIPPVGYVSITVSCDTGIR